MLDLSGRRGCGFGWAWSGLYRALCLRFRCQWGRAARLRFGSGTTRGKEGIGPGLPSEPVLVACVRDRAVVKARLASDSTECREQAVQRICYSVMSISFHIRPRLFAIRIVVLFLNLVSVLTLLYPRRSPPCPQTTSKSGEFRLLCPLLHPRTDLVPQHCRRPSRGGFPEGENPRQERGNRRYIPCVFQLTASPSSSSMTGTS